DRSGMWTNSSKTFSYVGNLTPGAKVNFTVVFKALVNGTLINSVNVTSNLTGNKTANNSTRVYNPNLTVEKITLTNVSYVNGNVSFVIVVTNTGDCNLSGIKVFELFNSTEFKLIDFIDRSGMWTNSSKTFSYVGNLTPGAKANFTVVLKALVNGTLINTVNVTSNLTGNKTASNSTRVYNPNLTVAKFTLTNVSYVNGNVSFMIVVTNTGDCNLSNVTVKEIFNPKELDFYDFTNKDMWTNSSYVFTYKGILKPGESSNFTVIFKTLTNGTLINTVNATSNMTDNKTATNNTTVTNEICDLTVNKTVNSSSIFINNLVEWTITVVNNGPNVARNVTVNDTLIDGLELTSIPLNCTLSGRTIVWKIGDLKPNKPIVLKIVTNATKLGNLTNVVCVNTTTIESNQSNNQAFNSTFVNPICDLTINKTVSAKVIDVNKTVEWTITVVNNGPSVAYNVTVKDTLNDGLELIGIPSNCTFDGKIIIWKIGDLQANKPVSIKIVTKAVKEGNLTNMVSVNTTTTESNLTNNNASNSTFANPICDLVINKTVNASSIFVNKSVEWTITVVNNGPSVAYNVTVKDILPEGLELAETPKNCNVSGRTIIWKIGDLNTKTPIVLKIVTKAVKLGNLTNIVSVNTTTNESNKTNNNASNSTYVNPICDVAVNKTVNVSAIYIHGLVEWTITVVNNGPSVACNVTVRDYLPDGMRLVEIPMNCTLNNTILTWNVGDLEINKPISLKLITEALSEGKKINLVNVSTATNETDLTNNNADNNTFVSSLCDLVISKAVNATKVDMFDLVEWNITVANIGHNPAVAVVVNDTLPEGLRIISATPSIGSSSDNKTGIWRIDYIENNTSVFLILVTQVLKEGPITNTVTVNTTTNETTKSNNNATNTTVVNPICDLEISKIVNLKEVNVGEKVVWTIEVRNNGPSDAKNVIVIDQLPKSLKILNYKVSDGIFNRNNGQWNIGLLENGSSAILTIETQVLSDGNIMNSVSVQTTTKESDYTNNDASNTTRAIPIVDLELKKVSDKKSYYVGDEMHWIIEVTNHGLSTAKDVWVLDILPSSVKFIKFSASKGSYDHSSGNWSIGEIGSGEKVTLDILCKIMSEGAITNNAKVVTSSNESNLINNYDNATVDVTEPGEKHHDEPTPQENKSNPKQEPPIKAEVSLKNTGNPIAYLLIAICIILGSFWSRNRKE
ncbi:MAG: DUF11 domain-containing protein, partial [Methanobrevibacter sp.]|uniref:DUF11 domain-containing protein n=1 Tax=Methanobrevibacter sp. TaxID=66852 RepID=UPI0025FD18A6